MANIPGISGYVQPGTFARDRVVSRSVSVPGGLRTLALMGFGETTFTLVLGAQGSGQDGNATPSGASRNGRFFTIPNAPLVAGRTKILLNGQELAIIEKAFGSSDTVEKGYQAQLDIEKGILGLQPASFADQSGSLYSANSSNIGDGEVQTGSVSELEELAILDENTPEETWTLRCVSVTKDSLGANIKGKAKFSLTGSVSGQLKDSNGNAYLFSDTFKEGSAGSVYKNTDLATSGGYELMDGTNREGADGIASDKAGAWVLGTSTTDTSFKHIAIPLDSTLISTTGTDDDDSFVDRVQVGDFLVTSSGAAGQATAGFHKITKIIKKVQDDMMDASIANHNDKGYLVLELETSIDVDGTIALDACNESLDLSSTSVGIDFTHTQWGIVGDAFKLVATNAYVDTSAVDLFDSNDLNKVLLTTGTIEKRYSVKSITQPGFGQTHSVLRVAEYGNEDSAFANIAADETGLTYSLVETNEVLTVGIDGISGSVSSAFSVGDKFTIKVTSKTLKKNDALEARCIPSLNVNDPQLFVEAADLFTKHGTTTVENTIALGSQIAFENGAPAILATQCKPSVPRKTEETLIEERDSNGEGGLQVDTASVEANDLTFPISEVLQGGYRKGMPDSDTSVVLVKIRNGVETQIFPNKSSFYSVEQADSTGKQTFADSSSQYAFSYTVCATDQKEFGSGDDGAIAEDSGSATFTTQEFNFNSEHVGKQILIKSITHSDGTTISDTVAEINTYLDTGSNTIFEETVGNVKYSTVTIDSVVNDATVILSGVFSTAVTASDIRFTVIDTTETSDTSAALLLNKTLFTSGTLQNGDGLKIKYIDQNDADFFDTNWFEAFEKLEAFSAQIIVPLPTQTISSIFQAAVTHCETMSSIANRKERVAIVGAINGVTDQALIGNKLVAIEDVGVIEGIQGDDAEEVFQENIEDLQNFKLNENFTSKRCVYMFPDQIVRNINGTNTIIDGFYMAAAAAGRLAGTFNVAIPLTNKTLTGFNILRDRTYSQVILNQLGSVGATVVEPIAGGGRTLAARTTSNSGFIEDEEVSIIFIRDRVKEIMRQSLLGYIGTVQDSSTNSVIQGRVVTILNSLINQGLIETFANVSIERDKVDPRQINVYFRFVPTFPINYVFIDIEVGIS